MRERNNTLKKVAELFGSIGWDKRLCDLSEEEVLGIIVVMQSLQEVEDEFLSQSLADIYFKYKPKRAEDRWYPF
jgi:hypothetical protein